MDVLSTGTPGSTRDRYMRRLSGLKAERSTWISHWQDIALHLRPRSFRYLDSQKNKGTKQNQAIINNAGPVALRTMVAGLMTGMTSPARPWFKLGTKDPDLNKFGPVRAWLDGSETVLRQAFSGSNVYKELNNVYEGLCTIGTAAMHLEEDVEDILRAYTFPVGQYLLATSDRGVVDTCFREYAMTVGQLVKKFGLEACSSRVKELHNEGHVDQWIDVLHVIEPNEDYQPGKLGPKGKRYASVWMERAKEDDKQFLRVGGFAEFPLMAPRWKTTGEDVYGESPGMDALGDLRALQALERAKGKLVQKLVEPPMRGPSSLMNQATSLAPGGMTYVDAVGPGQTYAPVYETPPAAVEVVGAEIRFHEDRVRETFLANLWLMIANGGDGADPRKTATEIQALKEEKMQQLGSVLENIERELLAPLILRSASICLARGLFPKPPRELQGKVLVPEFVSVMAQAQKLLGTTNKERLVGFLNTIARIKPDAIDKVNFDALVEDYADDVGVPADAIVDQDQVDAARQQRAKAAAAQQQAETAATMAKTAQTAAQTPMDGDTALSRMLGGLGGPAAAMAGGGLPQ